MIVNSATNINIKNVCASPKPFPRFPTSYVLVFIVFSSFEVRGGCLTYWNWWNCWPSLLKLSLQRHISHRIVEYKKDHSLIIFMFCKLQNGKIEGIWYLQSNKACQVVECAWVDWCNLIVLQRTTKYKIRIKYNDNLRPNKYKENRKTTFV